MDSDSIDLRDQVAVLRRRWQLIAAVTAIGLVLGVLLSLIRTTQYEATTSLVVEPVAASAASSTTPVLEPEEIATQVQVIASRRVANRVLEELGLDESPEDLLKDISVEQVEDTRVVRVTAVYPDPIMAAQIADGFAKSYLGLRRQSSAAQLAAAQAGIRRQLQDARQRLRTVKERLRFSEAAIRRLPSVRAQLRNTQERAAEVRRRITQLSATRDVLIRTKRGLGNPPSDQQLFNRVNERLADVNQALAGAERTARQVSDTRQRVTRDVQRFAAARSRYGQLQDMRQALVQQITELTTAAAATDEVTRYNGGQVLRRFPAEPTAPLWRNAAAGTFLGLLIGLAFAFVRDRVDDAVRDEDRLREVLRDVPVLGRIPHHAVPAHDRPVTLAEPQAPASEAFRSLTTSVRFLLAASRKQRGPTAGGQVLLVTSAGQGEGKTTVATNLAVAAARFGLRVALIEADLRRPVIANRFGVRNQAGLSDVLATGAPVATHLVDVGVPNLRVLPGGSTPPNPAELLASPQTRALLRKLTVMGELVILDTPPISGVTDTSELVPYVDHVLLVTRRLFTSTRLLTDALERIRQIGGTVAGALFNDAEGRTAEETYGYRVLPREKRGVTWQRWAGVGGAHSRRVLSDAGATRQDAPTDVQAPSTAKEAPAKPTQPTPDSTAQPQVPAVDGHGAAKQRRP